MEKQEKICQIALSQTKGVGYILAKKLMAQFGSAQAIFQSTFKELIKIPGSGKSLAQALLSQQTFSEAANLLEHHEKANVRIITPWEADYPERLRHIHDAPTLLYHRGNTALNQTKIISIVGTRRATSYGKQVVETLLSELSAYPLLVVSGLAYGVDIHAHQTALELGLPTLAVVAGGVDRIYPSTHRKTVEVMLAQGGILSEHPNCTEPEAHQFAARNRIIAGLADATIVVEAGEKSGALITARCANDYNREVFAVCGGIYDPYSVGCHNLIKTHQAHLLTSAADVAHVMNWDAEASTSIAALRVVERLPELTEVEQGAVQTIGKLQKEVHIDELSYQSQIPLNKLATVLLQLEIKKVVKCLPGSKVRLAIAC